MKNGKELYFPKGGRGFEGEPPVPPTNQNNLSYYYNGSTNKRI
jgi:hypothetical protein